MTLFRKRLFSGVIKVRISKSYHPALSKLTLHPMTSVLRRGEQIKKKEEEKCKGERHAKMQAEIGVTQPKAKEHLEPLEAGEDARKNPPLEPSEGSQPCCHVDFSPVILTLSKAIHHALSASPHRLCTLRRQGPCLTHSCSPSI